MNASKGVKLCLFNAIFCLGLLKPVSPVLYSY